MVASTPDAVFVLGLEAVGSTAHVFGVRRRSESLEDAQALTTARFTVQWSTWFMVRSPTNGVDAPEAVSFFQCGGLTSVNLRKLLPKNAELKMELLNCRQLDGSGPLRKWFKISVGSFACKQKLLVTFKQHKLVTDEDHWSESARCANALWSSIRVGYWCAPISGKWQLLQPQPPALSAYPYVCVHFECAHTATPECCDLQVLCSAALMREDPLSDRPATVRILSTPASTPASGSIAYSVAAQEGMDVQLFTYPDERSLCEAIASTLREWDPVMLVGLGAESHDLMVLWSRFQLWGCAHGPVVYTPASRALEVSAAAMDIAARVKVERINAGQRMSSLLHRPGAIGCVTSPPREPSAALAKLVKALNGEVPYEPLRGLMYALSGIENVPADINCRDLESNASQTSRRKNRVAVRYVPRLKGRLWLDTQQLVFQQHDLIVDCHSTRIAEAFGVVYPWVVAPAPGGVDNQDETIYALSDPCLARLWAMRLVMRKSDAQGVQVRVSQVMGCGLQAAYSGNGVSKPIMSMLQLLATQNEFVLYTGSPGFWDSAVSGGKKLKFGELEDRTPLLLNNPSTIPHQGYCRGVATFITAQYCGWTDVRRMYPTIVTAFNVCPSTYDVAKQVIDPQASKGLLPRCMEALADAREATPEGSPVHAWFKELGASVYGCIAAEETFSLSARRVANYICERGQDILVRVQSLLRLKHNLPNDEQLRQCVADAQRDEREDSALETKAQALEECAWFWNLWQPEWPVYCLTGQTDSVRYTLPLRTPKGSESTQYEIKRAARLAVAVNKCLVANVEEQLNNALCLREGRRVHLKAEGVAVSMCMTKSPYCALLYPDSISCSDSPALVVVGMEYAASNAPVKFRAVLHEAAKLVLEEKHDEATDMVRDLLLQLKNRSLNPYELRAYLRTRPAVNTADLSPGERLYQKLGLLQQRVLTDRMYPVIFTRKPLTSGKARPFSDSWNVVKQSGELVTESSDEPDWSFYAKKLSTMAAQLGIDIGAVPAESGGLGSPAASSSFRKRNSPGTPQANRRAARRLLGF